MVLEGSMPTDENDEVTDLSVAVGVILKSAEFELSDNTAGVRAFDELTFVPLDMAERVLENSMPVDENTEVTAIPIAEEVTVTLFS
jgi:hypothetical protein